MASISSHTVSVNVASQQRNIIHVKPVSNMHTVTRPEPIVNDTKVIQIARPATNVQTIVQAQNVTKFQEQPEVINTQSTEMITQPTFSSSQSYVGNNVDIYV